MKIEENKSNAGREEDRSSRVKNEAETGVEGEEEKEEKERQGQEGVNPG